MARGSRGPRIIDGPRSPADFGEILAKDESERRDLAVLRAAGARSLPPPPDLTTKPEYPVRFVSAATNYLLMLDIPTENVDGSVKHHRFNVAFHSGEVDIRQRVYPFSTKRVSDAILAASGYGLGRQFWDYEAQERALNEAQKEQGLKAARAALKDPETRAALRAELEADTFDLGEPDPQTPGSTP
jgi:hypothetical protein